MSKTAHQSGFLAEGDFNARLLVLVRFARSAVLEKNKRPTRGVVYALRYP